MNADRLLAHYEEIADARDAIPLLRRFVLDLAVRGKLVKQDPNDEPAAIPLTGGERCELHESYAADNPGWLIAPVGALLEFRYGKGMKSSERLDQGPVPVFGSNGIVGYCETPLTEAPSIVVGRKGSAGALNLCNGPSWTTDVAYFVEAPCYFDLRYLLIGLQVLDLGSLGKGVKPGLSRSDAYDLPLSVPPIAEQYRIVAKVDELMALCDQLEAARAAQEKWLNRLAAASLARLNAPNPDPVVCQNHAAFVLDNLIPLTKHTDQIKALRQTVLNLAVRGKLVKQDPNDEPASELLKRIALEKARLAKARMIRRRISIESASASELIYELPNGWAATSFSDVLIELQTGPFGSSLHQSDYEIGGIPVINPASIQDGKIVPVEKMAVGENTLERLSTFKLQVGDIVMGRRGEMGRCAVVTENEEGWLCGTGSLILRLPRSLYPKYLAMLIGSPHVREYLEGFAVGATMQNLNQSILLRMRIGFPPLAEQHRIMAKVDELMSLFDQLEASLARIEDARCHLLDALMCNAMTPSKENLRRDTSMITQESYTKPPELLKALAHPTPTGTSAR